MRETMLGTAALPEHQASLAGIAEHRTMQGTLALPEHQVSQSGIAEHRTIQGTLALPEHQASQAAMQEIRIKMRETRRKEQIKMQALPEVLGIPKTAAVQTIAALQQMETWELPEVGMLAFQEQPRRSGKIWGLKNLYRNREQAQMTVQI